MPLDGELRFCEPVHEGRFAGMTDAQVIRDVEAASERAGANWTCPTDATAVMLLARAFRRADLRGSPIGQEQPPIPPEPEEPFDDVLVRLVKERRAQLRKAARARRKHIAYLTAREPGIQAMAAEIARDPAAFKTMTWSTRGTWWTTRMREHNVPDTHYARERTLAIGLGYPTPVGGPDEYRANVGARVQFP